MARQIPTNTIEPSPLTTNNVTLVIVVCVALLILSVVFVELMPWLSW